MYNEERNLFAVKVVNLITKDGFTDKDLMHEIHLLKVRTSIFFRLKHEDALIFQKKSNHN